MNRKNKELESKWSGTIEDIRKELNLPSDAATPEIPQDRSVKVEDARRFRAWILGAAAANEWIQRKQEINHSFCSNQGLTEFGIIPELQSETPNADLPSLHPKHPAEKMRRDTTVIWNAETDIPFVIQDSIFGRVQNVSNPLKKMG